MPLVPAKCPECGGNVVVDSDKDAGVCEFCKAPFIVEKAINHFNTINNVTNNIKADTVNLNTGKSIEDELKGFKEKILLSIKLKDREKLSKEIKELFIYKENNFERSEVHLTFLELLIDAYKLAIEGCSWDNNITYQNSNYTTIHKNTLEMLLDEMKVIKGIDEQSGFNAESMVNAFYDYLYLVITTPVSKENDFINWNGRFNEVRSFGVSDEGAQMQVSLDFLAYNFIIGRHYPPKYETIYLERIQPVLKACKEQYIGCTKIFGRFVALPACYYDDGYRCTSVEYKMIDYSITNLEQINIMRNKFNGRLSPWQIDYLEEEVRHLNWGINDNRCWECKNKLSLFGKCKTPKCKNYGKSLREEMSKLQQRIEIGKGN